ncbi:MAG: CRISPR-associated endonuclease Cas6 [Ferruginibacter sp.]
MHITTISFNLPLRESQIPVFKQAILEIPGIDQELYNNKLTGPNGVEKNINDYPPVQYRVYEGHASLWALNKGAVQLEKDLKKKKLQRFFWEGREREFALVRHFTNASESCTYLAAGKYMEYRLHNYLPLSAESHKEYSQAKDIYKKIAILERLLVSHLVLFSYAAGWELKPKQLLKAKIVDILAITEGVYKKYDPQKAKHYIKFDLLVKINAHLPDGISIGNQKSLGYGVLEKLEE